MIKFLKNYCLRYWPYYVLGIVALLCTNYMTVLIPLKIKSAMDAYGQGQSWEAVRPLILALIWLAVGLLLVRSLSRVLMFIPGRHVEHNVRQDYYMHLMRLSRDFYRRMPVGDLMSRAVNDIQNLRLLVGLALLHVVNTSLMYGFVFYQMGKMSLLLTICTALPIPFAILFVKKLARNLYRYNQETQEELGSITNFIVETLGGIHIVKSFAAEQGIMESFRKENLEYEQKSLRVCKVRAQMFPFIGIISSVGHLLLFIVGGRMVINGDLTVGGFVAFSTYIHMLAWPTAAFAWIINLFQRGKVSLVRINRVLDETPSVRDGEWTDVRLRSEESVALSVRHLNFSFPESDVDVLKDISFDVKKGQVLGVFGPTGSGKTVLSELLSGMEKAPNDSIFVNGHALEKWPIDEYRQMLSYVPQSSFLFSQSIQQNIMYGEQPLEVETEEHLFASAQKACVVTDIESFTQQYQTLIGEQGVVLSGGQKNRIALARALYKEHGLLILDDILSAVDHRTEKNLIDRVIKESPEVTKIVVSHRISALESSDQIIVLEKGCMTDKGTFEELTCRDGIFKDTWLYQRMEQDV